jgi:hypothetical protein
MINKCNNSVVYRKADYRQHDNRYFLLKKADGAGVGIFRGNGSNPFIVWQREAK